MRCGADEKCLSFTGWGSLEPGRERARLPSELLAGSSTHPRRDALEGALVVMVDALTQSFPGNLFADHDALAATLLSRSSDADIERAAARIAALHRLYGSQTIRFQYAHDFLYGYDWARWAQRDPATRARVGPFDDAFLDYLEVRGHELLALIANDDAKYPTLRTEKNRNPFPFSREPDAERRLHRSLADKGLIPVPGWEPRTRFDFDRPWSRLREEEADALGLSDRSAGRGAARTRAAGS